MFKLTVLILFWLLSFHCVRAQQSSVPPPGHSNIRGSIADTIENKKLTNSSILLLRQSDSIIVQHTRTGKNGQFQLGQVSRGKYLLVATYPGYADYVDELEIKEDSAQLVLPPISLVLKSKLLEQVVVSGNKGAIRIKADTVEFKADSFHTEAGATVEELLKKLPGIQIDSKGKITAQGQTVQKVLVDGEEFFGDDPTLVTQNLRADMVDKVQLYDKKSDQAAFTGIDDGKKEKTLNLKLKDNKKNGYFGKVNAARGTDGYYDAQAMINLFKKKKKLAGYGIVSNTGKMGLNWGERDNYGQSIASMLDFDESTGGFSFNMNSDELDSWSGRFEGQGLPKVKTGGLHYNDKWDEDRQSVNANYKYMDMGVRDSSNSNTQYILPDSLYSSKQVYYSNQNQRSDRNIVRHSMDGSYEIKFDSTSSLKINADGGTDHKVSRTAVSSKSLARDSSLINDNMRTISDVGDKRQVNSNLLWRKKLAKKGRTVSLNIRENFSDNSSSGYLNSRTNFYDQGVFNRDSVIDQYKQYKTTTTLLESRLSYTEPLSAHASLIFNYGVTYSTDHSNRNSYNNAGNGKYTILDTLYSNDYQFDVLNHKGGIAYSLVKKKIKFSIGNGIGFAQFDQKDLHKDTSVKRNFVNWYPQTRFTYNFSPQRWLNVSYNGYTNAPSIQQIQPIRTNEDPLNISLGNPGLKQEFVNRFGLNFSDYKVLTERSVWFNAAYSFTKNAISNRTSLDSTGKTTSQDINVDGNYNVNAYLSYDFKWKKPGLNISFNTNINQSRNVNVVNTLKNATSSGSYQLGASIGKSIEKKLDAGIRGSGTFTRSRSTINSGIKTEYWTWSINPYMDLYFPLKFQLHADCDISLRQKTSVFDKNTNVSLLNAWIGKKFLKNDVLQVRATGNDLLNQNLGFNRSVSSNFINQSTNLTIKRYFMLSVVWNFSKTGSSAPKE